MSLDPLQQRVVNLIKPLIPPDAEERVSRAFKQWNQIIRDHIRNATGLKLSDGDRARSIPVKIVEGFSPELARLIDENDDPILWRLIIGQPKIGAMMEGTNFLLKAWDEIALWPKLPSQWKTMQMPLQRANEFGNALQKLAIAERLRQNIKNINRDILGAYFCNTNIRIELYWIPIAMVAAMLNVRIEDLTLVVLTHELSHGYTHLGKDIDGSTWAARGFRDSEVSVIEGLAQFYTHIIMDSIATRTPGPKAAYESFLELQSGPYLVHKEWLSESPDRTREIVRFALVAARNRKVVEYSDWKQLIVESRGSLLKRIRSDVNEP